jgi:hypothetical protein
MFSFRSLTVGLIAAVALIVGPAVASASATTDSGSTGAVTYSPLDFPWT